AMITSTGWISARLGRKRLYTLSLAAFTLISLMCGNADSLEEEVLWRFLQGVSGAPLIPLSQSIVIDVYPRAESARALGIWAIGMMVGPVIAPPIGGWITDLYGWPAVFFINLPIGLCAFLGAILFIPSTRAERGRRIDAVGLGTLVVGLVAIQLMLNRGTRLDWFASGEILITFSIGVAFLYAFVVHALTGRDTLIDPAMFRDRNYAFGICLIAFFGAQVFLPTLLLPLMLKNLVHYPIDMIGLLLAPRALGIMITSPITGRLAQRSDPRLLVVAGFLMISTSYWFMGQWNLDVGPWEVAWTGLLQGAGSNLIFVPLNALTFRTLDGRYRGDAVPLFYLVLNLGASAGIATVMTYLTQDTQTAHAILSENITLFGDAARDTMAMAGIEREVSRQAGMIAYNNTFIFIAVMAVLPAPFVYLLRPVRT
ncbi:MAG: DHA2 family efflux MFS transporter permease subunit, partial [Rhodospirillaceae bacterium]|nr:DHA2 family efflux MFS transporter permease subunit [Rhodospirillaceae bacterium]